MMHCAGSRACRQQTACLPVLQTGQISRAQVCETRKLLCGSESIAIRQSHGPLEIEWPATSWAPAKTAASLVCLDMQNNA